MFIPPPAYQLEAISFKLDLSCLASDPQSGVDAIAAIDSQANEWPFAALRQATTLDDSQLRALQARTLATNLCVCNAHMAQHMWFLCVMLSMVLAQCGAPKADKLACCRLHWIHIYFSITQYAAC